MKDIVFLTVDSLRADHVGWHGYDRDTTPFLDKLAASSHCFERAFANGCFTRRSFPSIMTSVYPSMYGGVAQLSEEQVTVAEALREEGYKTAGFHSNPHLLPRFGYDRGFDHFYDSETESDPIAKLRQWVKDNLDQSGITYKMLERAFAKSEETVGFNPGTPFVPAGEITDLAIEWINSATNGPRFLWIHYMDVHHPYSPPKEYLRQFRESPISERRAVKLRRKMLEEPDEITDAELSEIIDLYDGEIRYVDAEIERLVSHVYDEWGTDTIVSFTSDHGEEFGDHGQFSHLDTYYDELVHVPLLIDVNETSARHDDVVELVDVAPTFLDYADCEIPSSYVGSSLRSAISGEGKAQKHVICDGRDSCAYRDDTWKYIYRPEGNELYDLDRDPAETTNEIDDHPGVTDEIEATLDRYREQVRKTDQELDDVEIDGEVQDRLEQLGYLNK